MDLTLTDSERAFQEEWRAFLETNVPQKRVPYDESGAWVEQSRHWQRTLAEAGWAVPGWPNRWGGREATPVELMLYAHEPATVHPPRALNVIGTRWGGPPRRPHGT